MPQLAPILDALRSIDPAGAVLVVGLLLIANAVWFALSGVEGWILSVSFAPWLKGFALGAALAAAGGSALIVSLHWPSWAWYAVAGAGLLLGILAGRIAVRMVWATWWLRLILTGAAVGVAAYLAVRVGLASGASGSRHKAVGVIVAEFVAKSADGGYGPHWKGILRVAIALGAGGVVYLIAYRLLYPTVRWVRNSFLLAAGVVLLAVPEVRTSVIELGQALKAGGELRSEPIAAAIEARLLVIGVIGAAAALVVWYAMFIQRFRRSFYRFFRGVFEAKFHSFGMLHMLGCSAATAGGALVGMISARRFPEPRCRTLENLPEGDEDDEDDAEAAPRPARKKRANPAPAG